MRELLIVAIVISTGLAVAELRNPVLDRWTAVSVNIRNDTQRRVRERVPSLTEAVPVFQYHNTPR